MIDRRIKTFLLVCDLMNYHKAAEALGITQPAVTRQIRLLEQEYGCSLFEYRNQSLVKTSAAALLERYARSMTLQAYHLRRRLAETLQEVRIGATKTVGDYVLREEIFQYISREENTLTMIVDNTENLLRLLEENELDFAVVEGYFDAGRFDSHLLRREPFVGICPAAHRFAGKKVPLEEIFAETLIHREAGSGTRAILERRLSSSNESLSRFRRKICLSSFKLILDMVASGVGISFVYEVLAEHCPGVATFALEGEPIIREFNIVCLRHADLSEKINSFFPGRFA